MNSSIWPIDRTLTETTTLGQSGPGNNGDEGVLHIPDWSLTIRCSLMSYSGHSLEEALTLG